MLPQSEWLIDDYLTFLESIHAPRAMFIGANCVLVSLTNDARSYLDSNDPTWLASFPTNHHGADKRISALRKAISLEPLFDSLTITLNRRLARDFLTYADFSVWKSKYKERSDTNRAGNSVGRALDNVLDVNGLLETSANDAARDARPQNILQFESVTDMIRDLNLTFQARFDTNEKTQHDIKTICAKTQQQQQSQSLLISSNKEAIVGLGLDVKKTDKKLSDTTVELRSLIEDLQKQIKKLPSQVSSQSGANSPQQKFAKFLERSSEYLAALRGVQVRGEAIFVFKNDAFLSTQNGIVSLNMNHFQRTLYIKITRTFKLNHAGHNDSKNESRRFIITAPEQAQCNGNQTMFNIIENRSNSNTDFSVRWATPAAYNDFRSVLFLWKKKSIIFDFDYTRSGQFIIFIDRAENDPNRSRYLANKNARLGKSFFTVKDPLGLAYLSDPSPDILRKVGLFNTHFVHDGTVIEIERASNPAPQI